MQNLRKKKRKAFMEEGKTSTISSYKPTNSNPVSACRYKFNNKNKTLQMLLATIKLSQTLG